MASVMKSKNRKTAQEMQDEIFRKMLAEKKLKLASDFSMFILDSRKSTENNYGIKKVSQNSS